MTEKLFGTLHTPMKSLNYESIDTESILLRIDSINRKISAYLQPELLNDIVTNKSNIDVINSELASLTDSLDQLELALDHLIASQNDLINKVSEIDNNYASKTDIENIISSLDNLENYYTKAETDAVFVKKEELDNIDISTAITQALSSIQFIEPVLDTDSIQ